MLTLQLRGIDYCVDSLLGKQQGIAAVARRTELTRFDCRALAQPVHHAIRGTGTASNDHYACHSHHQCVSLLNIDPKKSDLRRLSISSMASCILVRTSWLIASTVHMSCAPS